MIAKYERRQEILKDKIWLAKWLNLQNYSHWHDEIEIIKCITGTLYINIEDKHIEITDGQSVIIESGKIHKIESKENSISMTILFDKKFGENATTNYSLIDNILEHEYALESFYQRIKQELIDKKLFFNNIIADYTNALISDIYRTEKTIKIENSSTSSSTHKHPSNYKYQLFKDILKEIELNYEFINFEDLCKKFGYSTSHFSRLFKSIAGITITEYLSYVKIKNSIEFIKKNEKTISQISSLCGFASIRDFNRTFKKITGFTPSSLPENFDLSNNFARKYSNDEYNPTKQESIQLD